MVRRELSNASSNIKYSSEALNSNKSKLKNSENKIQEEVANNLDIITEYYGDQFDTVNMGQVNTDNTQCEQINKSAIKSKVENKKIEIYELYQQLSDNFNLGFGEYLYDLLIMEHEGGIKLKQTATNLTVIG